MNRYYYKFTYDGKSPYYFIIKSCKVLNKRAPEIYKFPIMIFPAELLYDSIDQRMRRTYTGFIVPDKIEELTEEQAFIWAL
jgi:hypothetical protein